MDERSVRAQLTETKERLKQVDDEREILLSLIKGFEGWLRLNPTATQPELGAALAPARKMTPAAPSKAKPAKKNANGVLGTISMRAAVTEVIRQAHGSPIHASEIYRRAYEMGARTNGSRPEAIVDINAVSLSNEGVPIQRAGPRTWRWLEEGVLPD